MRLKLYLNFILLVEVLRGFLVKLFYKILGVSFKSEEGFRISSLTSFKIYIKRSALRFGKQNYIRRNCSIIVSGGVLKIGDNFFMNNYSSINCFGEIEIGNNCLFGEGVRLYDHNYDYKSTQQVPINKKGHKKGFIKIGNNSWLGSNTIVLMNVKIGNNVIVGANNLVFKDIPDNSIILSKQDLIRQEYLGV